MINIDRVYQKILTIANKEQRGYITPQEFNLMADKAQLEIFDKYFYDLKTAAHKQTTQFSTDEIETIHEKLNYFHETSTVIVSFGGTISASLNNALYKLDNLKTTSGELITQLSGTEVGYTEQHPLLKAGAVANRNYTFRFDGMSSDLSMKIELFGIPLGTSYISSEYWRRPNQPQWAYVVVDGRPLYNQSQAVHFELHPSEEEAVVARILQLFGIIVQRPDLQQAALTDQQIAAQEKIN